jgi:hypothetical protein
MKRVRVCILLSFIAGGVMAPVVGYAGAFTHLDESRHIATAVLITDSTGGSGQPTPTPFAFYAADQAAVRPGAWAFYNPLAPRRVTAQMAVRWFFLKDSLGAPAYPEGRVLEPDMHPYWEVELSAEVLPELEQFDAVLLPINGNVTFTDSDRDLLEAFVDAGGVLWIDSVGGNAAVQNFFTPLSFAGGGVSLTPQDWAHPLLTYPEMVVDYDLLGTAAYRAQRLVLPVNTPLFNVLGDAAPYVAACAYGSGMIVVTAGAVSQELHDMVLWDDQAARAFPSEDWPQMVPEQRADLRLTYNLVTLCRAWREHNAVVGGHASRIGTELSLLSRKWHWAVGAGPEEPAPGKLTSALSAPVSDRGIAYAAQYDGANWYVVAYDVNPTEDLDGDGDSNDGLQDSALEDEWLAPLSRDLIWRWQAPAAIVGTPAVARISDTTSVVLVPCGNGRLYALAAARTAGTPALLSATAVVWTWPLPSGGSIEGPIAVSEELGLAFVAERGAGANGNRIYAIRLSNGSTVGVFDASTVAGTVDGIVGPMAVARVVDEDINGASQPGQKRAWDLTLYAGSTDGTLYAVVFHTKEELDIDPTEDQPDTPDLYTSLRGLSAPYGFPAFDAATAVTNLVVRVNGAPTVAYTIPAGSRQIKFNAALTPTDLVTAEYDLPNGAAKWIYGAAPGVPGLRLPGAGLGGHPYLAEIVGGVTASDDGVVCFSTTDGCIWGIRDPGFWNETQAVGDNPSAGEWVVGESLYGGGPPATGWQGLSRPAFSPGPPGSRLQNQSGGIFVVGMGYPQANLASADPAVLGDPDPADPPNVGVVLGLAAEPRLKVTLPNQSILSVTVTDRISGTAVTPLADGSGSDYTQGVIGFDYGDAGRQVNLQYTYGGGLQASPLDAVIGPAIIWQYPAVTPQVFDAPSGRWLPVPGVAIDQPGVSAYSVRVTDTDTGAEVVPLSVDYGHGIVYLPYHVLGRDLTIKYWSGGANPSVAASGRLTENGRQMLAVVSSPIVSGGQAVVLANEETDSDLDGVMGSANDIRRPKILAFELDPRDEVLQGGPFPVYSAEDHGMPDPDLRDASGALPVYDLLSVSDLMAGASEQWAAPLPSTLPNSGKMQSALAQVDSSILCNVWTGKEGWSTIAVRPPVTVATDESRIVTARGDAKGEWSNDATFQPVEVPPLPSGVFDWYRWPLSRPTTARNLLYLNRGADYLVSDTGSDRVVEVDRDGTVQWALGDRADGTAVDDIPSAAADVPPTNDDGWDQDPAELLYAGSARQGTWLPQGASLRIVGPTDAARWESEDADYVYYRTFVADSGNHRLLSVLERMDKATGEWLTHAGQPLREIVWASSTNQTVRVGAATGVQRQQSRYRFASITPVTDATGAFAGVVAAVTNFGLHWKETRRSAPLPADPNTDLDSDLLVEYPEQTAGERHIPTASILFAEGRVGRPTTIGEIAWAIDRIYLYDRRVPDFYRDAAGTRIPFGIFQRVNSVEVEWADDYPANGDRTYYLTVTATLAVPWIEDDPAAPGRYRIRQDPAIGQEVWLEFSGVYPLVYPVMFSDPASPWNETAVVSLPGPIAGAPYPYGQEWYFQQYDYIAAMQSLGAIEAYQEILPYMPSAPANVNKGEFPRGYTNPTAPESNPNPAQFFIGFFEPTWAKRMPEDVVAPDGSRVRQSRYLVANGSATKGELLEIEPTPMLPADPAEPKTEGPPVQVLNVRDVLMFICPAPYTYATTPSLSTTFGVKQPTYVERVN